MAKKAGKKKVAKKAAGKADKKQKGKGGAKRAAYRPARKTVTAKRGARKASSKKKPQGLKRPSARKAAKKTPRAMGPRGLRPREMTAGLAPCVPATQAGPLVMGCAGRIFNVETTLGVAFPSPNRREQFCQCVATRSRVPRAQIPCGAGDKFIDVIEAITC